MVGRSRSRSRSRALRSEKGEKGANLVSAGRAAVLTSEQVRPRFSLDSSIRRHDVSHSTTDAAGAARAPAEDRQGRR